MISVTSLEKSFGKNKVLRKVNLEIDSPGIYAILGPNGSGKTTLIKSFLGMVIPNKGGLTVMNAEVKKNWEYRKRISYLPQLANFPENLRVKELFRMIKDIRKQEVKEDELIASFELEPFMNDKLSVLSGGTKQKVNLVLCFMFDSPLMILDEPTSGLDPSAMLQLKELIARERKKDKTIIVTSHIMQFVEEIADEIVYLLDGEVYFRGSIEDLMKKTGGANFEHAIALIAKDSKHV